MLRKILKAGTWVFLGILLGRLAGLAREIAIAAHLGATPNADMAVLLLTAPDIMRNLLVGGAMEAALIPEFKRLGDVDGRALYHQFMLLSGGIFTVIALALSVKATWVVRVFAPGFDGPQTEAALRLIRISMWSLPVTVITATSTAFLQSHHKFAIPALGTLTFNLVLILALIIPIQGNILLFLSWAVVIGAGLRWLSQFLRVEMMTHPPSRRSPGWQVNRRILVRYFQVFTAGGIIFLLPVLARRLASFDGNGAMALFNYSQKMVELPSGVCLTVFAVALLPTLSELLHDETRMQQGVDLIRHGLILVFALALTLAMSIAWFSPQITQMAFGWGKMGSGSLGIISILTVFGMISLPAQGLASITLAAFNAKRDNKPAFFISLGALILYIPLAVLLKKTLGLVGIMLALAIANWLIFIAHIIVLRFRHGMHLIDRAWFTTVLRMSLVSMLAFAPVVFISHYIKGNTIILLIAASTGICGFSVAILSEDTYRQKAFAWARQILPKGN